MIKTDWILFLKLLVNDESIQVDVFSINHEELSGNWIISNPAEMLLARAVRLLVCSKGANTDREADKISGHREANWDSIEACELRMKLATNLAG